MPLFSRRFKNVDVVDESAVPAEAHLLCDLRADVAGLTRLFVNVRGNAVTVDHELADILGPESSYRIDDLDPVTTSSLLGRHVYPLPATMYRDVYALNCGDTLRVHEHRGRGLVVIGEEFPYFEAANTGKSVASGDSLLAHLVTATERQLQERDSVLLLSSGKDSVSILLALAELGRQDSVTAVTYANTPTSDESLYAAGICKRLGFRHETVVNEPDSATLRGLLIRYFEQTPQPCLDRVMVPMVQLVDAMDFADVNLIDGSGNDVYVGFPPSRRLLQKFRLSRFSGLFNLLAGGMIRPSSRLQFLLLNKTELCLEDTNFMHRELSCLLKVSRDPALFWRALADRHPYGDSVDFRSYLSGKYLHTETYQTKTRNVADLTSSHMVFPWCDADLARYYFNLPRELKYDRRELVNKLLVRRMLREKINYPDREIGKRAFVFDVARFYRTHRDWIYEEVLGCPLYGASSRRYVEGIRRRDGNEGELVSLLMLFQLAGWVNHCRYLQR